MEKKDVSPVSFVPQIQSNSIINLLSPVNRPVWRRMGPKCLWNWHQSVFWFSKASVVLSHKGWTLQLKPQSPQSPRLLLSTTNLRSHKCVTDGLCLCDTGLTVQSVWMSLTLLWLLSRDTSGGSTAGCHTCSWRVLRTHTCRKSRRIPSHCVCVPVRTLCSFLVKKDTSLPFFPSSIATQLVRMQPKILREFHDECRDVTRGFKCFIIFPHISKSISAFLLWESSLQAFVQLNQPGRKACIFISAKLLSELTLRAAVFI